jgi:hypothetical protein
MNVKGICHDRRGGQIDTLCCHKHNLASDKTQVHSILYSTTTHTNKHPVYGTGQGSGNSPMIWCVLSSILFDCYATLSHNAQFCRLDGTESMSIGMIGFVDNSNGQTNCLWMMNPRPHSRQLSINNRSMDKCGQIFLVQVEAPSNFPNVRTT